MPRKTINKTYSSRPKKTIISDKSINKKHISVFSYNISWESMTGKNPKWMLCSNNTDPEHPKHHSVCVSNISRVIYENPADFVLLQEAANYNQLIKDTPALAASRMNHMSHKSDVEYMVTLWNRKYHLLDSVCGEFEPGRPWMALLFRDGLCVINVHFGHYDDEGELARLDELIRVVKMKLFAKSHKNKITRTIIGGDFNNDIKKLGAKQRAEMKNTKNTKNTKQEKHMLEINKTPFYYHPKKILTCCLSRTAHFDHVLDTQSPPLDIIIPNVQYMASDHKPILVNLHA